MSDETPPAIRLNNVFAGIEGVEFNKVAATLDPKVFKYFFRHLLAGHRGSHQALISKFFLRFYEHIHDVLQLPEVWDEENETTLAKHLNNLNFHDTTSLRAELESLRLLNPAPTPSGRRPAPRAPKHPRKSPAKGRDTGAVERSGS